jgi:hypothetical protein
MNNKIFMWSIIDGKEKVEKLYNGILPDLESIYIHEFTIITGEDIELDIRFDIKDMPKDKPSKWIERKINTVQFVFGFLSVKFIDFNIDEDFKKECTLKSEKIAIDKNKITIISSEGKKLNYLFCQNGVISKVCPDTSRIRC